jgi:hypothetical protein
VDHTGLAARLFHAVFLVFWFKLYQLSRCTQLLNWVFLNLWAGQALGRNKAFYGSLILNESRPVAADA